MKNYILLVLCWFCISSLGAQNLVITDAETKTPLENVVVRSLKGHFNGISNKNGELNIDGLNAQDSLYFSLLGYESLTFSYNELVAKKYQVSLVRKHFSLDNVVIVANKWQQDEKEVAQTHFEITASDIALKNPQTAADLLAQSGAIFIQKSQQGGGSPMIRGFATNRVLLSVDEVRMNNAIFRSGNLQNVISIDPFAVARTEILFGPASLMHGSDAIGGVMGFYTIKPLFSTNDKLLISGNVVARTATANNEMSGHADVKLGWKKWALVSSFSQNIFGDLKMGKNGPNDYLRQFSVQRIDGKDSVIENLNPEIQLNSAYSQHNFLQKIAFKASEQLLFTYAFHYSSTSNFDRYDRLLRTKNGLPQSAEWYYGPQKWLMQHLNISQTKKTKFYDDLSLNVAYQNFEESRFDRDFGKSILNERYEKVGAYSGNIDFKKIINEQKSLLYGIETIFNDVNSFGFSKDVVTNIAEIGPSRYPQSTWNSNAIYLNILSKISEKLHVEAGLRYSRYSIKAQFDTTFYPFPFTESNLNKAATTGSVGLVLSPKENIKLSGNLSTGFRAPNVDDMGKVFDSEPGFVVVPNTKLRAEYAYNADFGFAYIIKSRIKIDGSVFYTYLDNAMVRRNFTLNGLDSIAYNGEMSKVQAIQNAAYAQVYGFQFGLEIKLNNYLFFTANTSFQNGNEVLDNGSIDRLRHVAPWFGTASLNFRKGGFSLHFSNMFNGQVSADKLPAEEVAKDYLYAKDANELPFVPAWQTLNLRSQYKINEHLLLTFGLENLLNSRYKAYSSGLAAAGRNILISAKAMF